VAQATGVREGEHERLEGLVNPPEWMIGHIADSDGALGPCWSRHEGELRIGTVGIEWKKGAKGTKIDFNAHRN
jgi:hypothetical protein